MAKSTRVKSEYEIQKEMAAAAQQAFDASVIRFGGLRGLDSEFVQGALYGDRPDSLYTGALQEDADRSHRRYVYRLESLRRSIEQAGAEVLKFAAQLTEAVSSPTGDLAYRLRWADGAMEAGAKVSVLRIYIAVLELKGPVVAEDYAREQVLRGASDQGQSTSNASNVMARLTTAAWAYMVQGRFGF